MELLILNTELTAVAVLDTFESLIWTDRYCAYGDFEIYTKATDYTLSTLLPDFYMYNIESDHVMVIENREVKFDVEDGSVLIVRGRSIESVLDRRIIWSQTVLSGSLQNGIKKLLDENAISPTISDRTIPNLTFQLSTDPVITSLLVDAQFTRTNLYESIKKLCESVNIGFKITLSDDLESFVFKLYSGLDRSYAQTTNSYVVFSRKFENLTSSNYKENMSAYKNLTVVAGEGEGDARITKIVGSGAGISRREMYTDARDLSQTVDEVLISESEYMSHLEQRGIEDLSEKGLEQSFEGAVDITRMFKYRKDFFMGDIVTLQSDYNIEGRARITEMIRSQNLSGIDVYPTFNIII